MTEKDYSGTITGKIGKNAQISSNKQSREIPETKINKFTKNNVYENSGLNIKDYMKAGEIAKKAKEYAKSIVKKGVLLAELAEKIEGKIIELGGQLAFPVNLSIDDIAAHYTPRLNDETKAEGLINVDIGVHINGFIADTAFSADLTEDKRHTKLINAVEEALKKALEIVKLKKESTKLNEIGAEIEKAISKSGFMPIVNLSGHSLAEYNLHSGLTIPNVDNSSEKSLGCGAFAIEPFATSGEGAIYESSGGNIYHLMNLINQQVRDASSRQVLEFIKENKNYLPFSHREIEKKFGSKASIALFNLKKAGIIEEYPQLVEKSHKPVSQAEASFIISKGKIEIIVD